MHVQKTGYSQSTTMTKTWKKNSKGLWTLIVTTGSSAKKEASKGTDHYQGFLQLKVKARLRTVKTKLSIGRAHLEKRRGTAIEARDYCKKEGKWQEGGVIKAAGRSAGLGMAVENIQKNGE